MVVDAEENEIGLLDMLVVVAENLRLLIVGPIAVGLLALGVAFVMPKNYLSQAILLLPTQTQTQTQMQMQMQTQTQTQTPAQVAALMVAPSVLDPIIESLELSKENSIEAARAKLVSQIKATAGKESLLRLEVSASTPAEAQTIANAVIDGWLKSTVPGEQDRADMEKRLSSIRESLKSVRRLVDQLISEEGVGLLNKALKRGEADMPIAALAEMQLRYLNEALTISRQMRGLTRNDVVRQSPTLPSAPVPVKKGLIAVLAALGAAVVLLLWVFTRQVWRNAARDRHAAEKQARLRAALGLK